MRTIKTLNEGWQFAACNQYGEDMPIAKDWQSVKMPYVWNLSDPSEAGPRVYRCNFNLTMHNEQDQSFISFGAVAGQCKAWLNGIYLGEHRGGYSCFRFELNSAAKQGSNELIVLADNTRFTDIIPLGGDFNNYGGIYREVELICTGRTHFDLMHYGTLGLDLSSRPDGTVFLNSRIVGDIENSQVEYTILDQGRICAQERSVAKLTDIVLSVEQPHFWNGLPDPHLYQCRARLFEFGALVDEVILSFGFRAIKMTPDQGFFLNGEHLLLCGVAKHQDRFDSGCAPSRSELDKDMQLIREIGANAVRLSHYQHPQYFYDLCDKFGMVVWAEIPMLAMPDGNDGLMENARKQLKELILQCKHHPSICFWGIQNEIAMMNVESLEMYRKTGELNQLAKQLDPDRITASANMNSVKNKSQLNHITDMVGYNVYFGWYYGELEDYATFFDRFHIDNPTVPLGISEYGVDCSVSLHSPTPKRKDYSEEFQCLFHETAYSYIRERNWLWGSFVWNMFDFGSAIRNEGGVKGENRKGLVSFDRQIKKDAFYFYKASWAKVPVLHIAGRRYAKRCEDKTVIKVYANTDEVVLSINGREFERKTGKTVFAFGDVPLQLGNNTVTASAGDLVDEISLTRVEHPDLSYVYIDPNPGFNVNNWFTLETSQDDLFPIDRYSIMDEMGILQANEQVWQLLEQEVPQIANDPRSRLMPSITLLRVINRISGQFTEEYVKDLNRKLNAIPKRLE